MSKQTLRMRKKPALNLTAQERPIVKNSLQTRKTPTPAAPLKASVGKTDALSKNQKSRNYFTNQNAKQNEAETIGQLEKRNEDLTSENQRFKADLAQMKQDEADIIWRLNQAIEAKDDQVNLERGTLKSFSSCFCQVAKLEDQLFRKEMEHGQDLRLKLQQLQERLETMTKQLETTSKQNATYRNQLEGLEDDARIKDSLEETVSVLQKQLEQTKQIWEAKLIEAEKEALKDRQRMKETMEARLDSLAQEYKSQSRSLIQRDTIRIVQENEALRKRCQSLEEAANETGQKLQELQKQLDQNAEYWEQEMKKPQTKEKEQMDPKEETETMEFSELKLELQNMKSNFDSKCLEFEENKNLMEKQIKAKEAELKMLRKEAIELEEKMKLEMETKANLHLKNKEMKEMLEQVKASTSQLLSSQGSQQNKDIDVFLKLGEIMNQIH